jgi:hypothetical protein
MKITRIGILAIRGIPGLMQRIADAEKVTTKTVERWIRENETINTSSPLTKLAIINAIKEETGLTEEQLVEEVTEG